MATLVLGQIGRAVGGPIGGLLGAIVGGQIDRAVLGGGRRRPDVPAMQSAAYGEPIPWLFGRMRVSGNLIWSNGIVERSGSGKRGGNSVYTASLALGLSARPVLGIGRVWADGRQIRDADGRWAFPVTMRLHGGSERQAADPLLVAAEGVAGCPAYAGLAYVVFEDLALTEFGNRIPGFSFEVIADAGEGLTLGQVAGGLTGGRLQVEGGFPAVTGYAAASPGSVADALAPILEVSGAALVADGAALRLRMAAADAGRPAIAEEDCVTGDRLDVPARARQRLAGGVLDAAEIGHLDPERDFQPGLQRVERAHGLRLETVQLPAALSASAARGLAGALVARRERERLTRTVVLPWRALELVAGDVLRIGTEPALWRVRERRFEGFLLSLDLERVGAGAALLPGDGGRVLRSIAEPAGPTVLQVLDLPGLEGAAESEASVLVVGAGSGGWRGAGIEISWDDGFSYRSAGVLSGPTVMGSALTRLEASPAGLIDRWNHVDVLLESEAMWLEALDDGALLAGGNLAMLGEELIQFGTVEALGAGVFRLGRLLRGRRGSEAAILGHAPGERFVMLTGHRGVRVPVSPDRIGAGLRVRPMGTGDIGRDPVEMIPTGRSLRPFAPVGLVAARVAGGVRLLWRRRSRGGFGWADFVDAPLAEADETYRLRIWDGARLAREVLLAVPVFDYADALRAADGVAGGMLVEVAQMSAVVGPGAPVWLALED